MKRFHTCTGKVLLIKSDRLPFGVSWLENKWWARASSQVIDDPLQIIGRLGEEFLKTNLYRLGTGLMEKQQKSMRKQPLQVRRSKTSFFS